MGKPKLRSSMRALQVAIASLRPIGPMCVQLGKTDSFRGATGDLCASFNSTYFNTPSSCSSSSSLDLSKPTELPLPLLIDEDSCLFSTTPSSPPREMEVIPRGPIASTRFFFSPSTTKSIMEEAKYQVDLFEIASLDDPQLGKEEAGENNKLGFCEESVMMSMASEDPYRDFRVSMEEMVVAHGLTEWPRLQELLHCYLRLNEKRTHKIIVLAFVDLLMCLMAQDKDALGLNSFPSLQPLCSLDQSS